MGINSLTLSPDEIADLDKLILEKDLETVPLTNEYELKRIKTKNINLILYKTGKLVFNDSQDTLKILNSILNKEGGFDYILGSDEAGKGEWYGPLVVVGTALTPDEIIKLRISGVKDSKTMKKAKIMEIAEKIMKIGFSYRSVVLIPHSYNKLYSNFKKEGKSLNDLMAWAHSRVIHDLLENIEFNTAKVFIDEFDRVKTEERLKNVREKGVKIIQKTRAESEIPVATASIIAKYLFEKELDKLNYKFGLDLRSISPDKIQKEISDDVAKTHFKNVNNIINKKNKHDLHV